MLRIDSVEAGYGAARVLKGVSIEVGDDELVTVIGRNGAGKTTLLMAISGLVKVSSGSIWFGSARLDNRPAHETVQLGVCHVPQGRHLFPTMTVVENLDVAARTAAMNRRRLSDKLEEIYTVFPVLRDRKTQKAGSLSGGQQQMVAIARALMASPKVLLLDEPSTGLAPVIVESLMETILKLRSGGLSILLVEQNAVLALEMADRAYVMSEGRIQASGRAQDLRGSELVRDAYLGRALSS